MNLEARDFLEKKIEKNKNSLSEHKFPVALTEELDYLTRVFMSSIGNIIASTIVKTTPPHCEDH